MGDVRLLNHDDEQPKTWKEHFITTLIRITYGGVPPLVKDKASHRKVRILVALSNQSEMIFVINPLKRSEATDS